MLLVAICQRHVRVELAVENSFAILRVRWVPGWLPGINPYISVGSSARTALRFPPYNVQTLYFSYEI
jgi:hypothetical protein